MGSISKQGIIYEDEKCYVVLDKYPATKGHLLVIPRKHYKNMLETPKEVIDDAYEVAKKAALRLKDKLKPDGLNITTNIGKAAGQLIMHFHIHVIPRYEEGRKEAKFKFDRDHQITRELERELQQLLKW
jgi:histidine triad (HIT) family protein